MARCDQGDMPPWLALVSQPGVIETIAALYNHGPASYAALRTYVELDGSGQRTAGAVRRLAAWQMCQRQDTTGSWDEPAPASSPGTVYELTSYGQEFAQVLVGWRKVVEQMPPELRRSLRRRR